MRSRNKVLSSEVKTLRSQMMTLVEKGRHDDELIDALMVCRQRVVRAEPPQMGFLQGGPAPGMQQPREPEGDGCDPGTLGLGPRRRWDSIMGVR